MQYTTPSSAGAAALSIMTIFFFLELVIVALRIWSIRIIRRSYFIHDYLIFASVILSCGYLAGMYISFMAGGEGHHIKEVHPSQIVLLLKMDFAIKLMFRVTATVIRLSVLFLYLDMFRVQRSFRHMIYFLFFATMAVFVGYTLAILLVCHPISHLWDTKAPGHCNSSTPGYVSSSVINLVLDAAIVCLPIRIVFKLQMSQSKKWRVMGMFGIGFIICLIDLSRLITTLVFYKDDATYRNVGPAVLTALELEFGIINASLPTINPFLKYASKRIGSGRKFASLPSWTINRSRSQDSASTTQRPLQMNQPFYSGPGKSTISTMIHSTHTKEDNATSVYGDEAIMVTRDVTVESKGDVEDRI